MGPLVASGGNDGLDICPRHDLESGSIDSVEPYGGGFEKMGSGKGDLSTCRSSGRAEPGQGRRLHLQGSHPDRVREGGRLNDVECSQAVMISGSRLQTRIRKHGGVGGGCPDFNPIIRPVSPALYHEPGLTVTVVLPSQIDPIVGNQRCPQLGGGRKRRSSRQNTNAVVAEIGNEEVAGAVHGHGIGRGQLRLGRRAAVSAVARLAGPRNGADGPRGVYLQDASGCRNRRCRRCRHCPPPRRRDSSAVPQPPGRRNRYSPALWSPR